MAVNSKGSSFGTLKPIIDPNSSLAKLLGPATENGGGTNRTITWNDYTIKKMGSQNASSEIFDEHYIKNGTVSELAKNKIPSNPVATIHSVDNKIVPRTTYPDAIVRESIFRGNGSNGQRFSTNPEDKKTQLKNLIGASYIIDVVNKYYLKDVNFHLSVVSGIYTPEVIDGVEEEIIAGSQLEKRTQGRCVVCQVIGINGSPDMSKTADVARYIAENCRYDRVCLDYNSYHPSGALSVSIILEMPEILYDDEEVTHEMKVSTCYNGNEIATNEFIEYSSYIA